MDATPDPRTATVEIQLVGSTGPWLHTIRVLIDDETAGTFKGREPASFPVAPGAHEFMVRCLEVHHSRWGLVLPGGIRSLPTNLTLSEGERVALECGFNDPASNNPIMAQGRMARSQRRGSFP